MNVLEVLENKSDAKGKKKTPSRTLTSYDIRALGEFEIIHQRKTGLENSCVYRASIPGP